MATKIGPSNCQLHAIASAFDNQIEWAARGKIHFKPQCHVPCCALLVGFLHFFVWSRSFFLISRRRIYLQYDGAIRTWKNVDSIHARSMQQLL